MAKKLQETRGSFKVIGRVSRIDRDNAYREEVMDNINNRNHDRLYRSLRFGIRTSLANEITVQTFDYEPTEVFLWNSKKREADENYKGERIPYGKWLEQEEDLKEQGFSVLQSRIGLEYGEDGRLKTKGVPRYVASEEIYNNLENGDSVVIEGTIRYSTYTNRNQEEVKQVNYNIERVFRVKDIDFEAENFEEVTYFEQKMVFVDADVDKKESKAYITGRIIDWNGNYEDSQFIIDFSDGEGGVDAGMEKLANAFKDRMKFGDVINVFGDALNKVVTEEVEDDGDYESNLLAEFGGRSKPSHTQNFTARTYVSELQIHGVDEWDEGVYEEDDFIKDDGLIESDSDDGDLSKELGGKAKPKSSSPFKTDGEDEDDVLTDDALPF